MMNDTLILPDSLGALEYDVPCEWEDCPCGEPAAMMCQGCGDDHPRAICLDHYSVLRRWFEDQKPAVCICGRPFMHFDTHYSILVF